MEPNSQIITNPLTVLRRIFSDEGGNLHHDPTQVIGLVEGLPQTDQNLQALRIVIGLCETVERLHEADGKTGLNLMWPMATQELKPAAYPKPFVAALNRPVTTNYEVDLSQRFNPITVEETKRIMSVVDELVGLLSSVDDESQGVARELARYLETEVRPLIDRSAEIGLWLASDQLLHGANGKLVAFGLHLGATGNTGLAIQILSAVITVAGLIPGFGVPAAAAGLALMQSDQILQAALRSSDTE